MATDEANEPKPQKAEERSSSPAQPGWTKRAWQNLSSPQKIGGALVVAVIATLVGVAVGNLAADNTNAPTGTSTAPGSTSSECETEWADSKNFDKKELGREFERVCRNEYWRATPTVFERSLKRTVTLALEEPPLALLRPDGQPVALTVEDLVGDSTAYLGKPVYVVGKIEANVTLPEDLERIFAASHETRLGGRDEGTKVIVGISDELGPGPLGGIAAVLGIVWARGQARFIGTRRSVDAAHVYGLTPPLPAAAMGSPAIRKLGKRLD